MYRRTCQHTVGKTFKWHAKKRTKWLINGMMWSFQWMVTERLLRFLQLRRPKIPSSGGLLWWSSQPWTRKIWPPTCNGMRHLLWQKWEVIMNLGRIIGGGGCFYLRQTVRAVRTVRAFSKDLLSFADLIDRRSVKSPSKIFFFWKERPIPLSIAGFLERHVKYIPWICRTFPLVCQVT